MSIPREWRLMMSTLIDGGWVPVSLRLSLRPTSAPWATWPALRATLAAGLIAVGGVATHRLSAVALMYFGAACAVVFVTDGVLRTRLVALSSQGLGAAAGLGLGAIGTSSDLGKVLIATAVGLLCGMAGAIGRMTTAFALMAVIGVAFSQFGNVPLPWTEQAAWYLVGTTIVSIAAIAPAVIRPRRFADEAIARVFEAAAELSESIGTPAAPQRRRDLAAASANCRAACYDYRVRPLGSGRSSAQLAHAVHGAETAALAAAVLYSRGGDAAPDVAAADAAAAIRNAAATPRGAVMTTPLNNVLEPPVAPGLLTRFRLAAVAATNRSASAAGLRLAWCMAIATAVTCAIHRSSHSYWLPLTVAVVVRPEYASVFVRTVNRVLGTVAGAGIAACCLLLPSPRFIAAAAALSIGWAVFAAPKLYGLSVIGITGSALLSASISTPDLVNPALRLLDTLAGCVIAIVFGYLLWPGRRSLSPAAHTSRAAAAVADYVRTVATAPTERADWPAVRYRAYQLSHQTRIAVQAALSDPPPQSRLAADQLPAALALEDAVDAITRLDETVRRTGPPPRHELDALVRAVIALGGSDPDVNPETQLRTVTEAVTRLESDRPDLSDRSDRR